MAKSDEYKIKFLKVLRARGVLEESGDDYKAEEILEALDMVEAEFVGDPEQATNINLAKKSWISSTEACAIAGY